MLNWVDITILLILLLYGLEGYSLGALPAFFDLIEFTLSFLGGLKLYALLGPFLAAKTGMPQGIANAISFFIFALLIELLLQFFFRNILKNVSKNSFLQKPELKQVNKLLGVFPGMLSGLVLVMFLITVVISLPVSSYLKNALSSATIGNMLLARSQLFEKQVGGIFGPAGQDTLNFLTLDPQSSSTVQLHFTYKNTTPDEQAENQMFLLVNTEREKAGLPDLEANDKLQSLARNYASAMLAGGYFSHFTPEGLSPFDRMDRAGISYSSAGENLAFAPNVTIAMQGLMQSPEHRANILSKDFTKIGIGVIDAGVFGQMFVQEFTN